MKNTLYSLFCTGENRVSLAILYVFERISFNLMTQIIQSLIQEPEGQLLTFRSQPVGPDSVPDSRIRSSFSYWIEAKQKPRSVQVEQIRSFLNTLDKELSVETQRLIILTPDVIKPNVISYLQDDRIVWASYEDLVAIVEGCLEVSSDWMETERPIPSDRERILLRELVQFLIAEELVVRGDRQVLVVPGRVSMPNYIKFNAYICQPERAFQEFSHMAFYVNNQIDRKIPVVLGVIDQVVLLEEDILAKKSLNDEIRERLINLVQKLREKGSAYLGQEHKVILLSSPDSDRTIILDQNIQNDLYSIDGRSISFTRNHRYVDLVSLKIGPKTTSQLLSIKPD